MFRAGSDSIDSLRHKVREGVSKLRGIEIADEVGVEILAELIEGNRAVSEIVERVYGLTGTHEGYASAYGKVRREIRRLESKGLVSRALFGREKPYRLTELAVINLARIGGGERQMRAVPKMDLAAYGATLALSLPVGLLAVGWLQLSNLAIVGVFGCFCFLLGISFCEIVRAVKRVF